MFGLIVISYLLIEISILINYLIEEKDMKKIEEKNNENNMNEWDLFFEHYDIINNIVEDIIENEYSP